MSGNHHQRVRRNASPSTIQTQRPMKALIAFPLKNSPTRKSPASSPTAGLILARRSPDSRNSPERKSPSSPSFKVERPKAVKASSSLRRTGSLEAIGPAYLKGQWPTYTSEDLLTTITSFKAHKSTQTPDDWEQRKDKSKKKHKKSHRRSASFGHGDQLAVSIPVSSSSSSSSSLDVPLNSKLIKQRLQRSKEGTTVNQKNDSGYKQPIPASHQALSSTAPAALQSFQRISKPLGIPAHIPKTNMSRYQRNSVEGLSQEIEKLVLKRDPYGYQDNECFYEENEKVHDIPDGHRAPVMEVLNRASSTRSVDTQTPSGCIDLVDDTGSSGSRSHSISPAIPIIPGHMDSSRPSSNADSLGGTPREVERLEREVDGSRTSDSPDPPPKVVSSPRPNKSYSFVREPPDGCEKVKVIDENKKVSQPSIKEPLLYCPIKPSQFVLKPSEVSAFCPLQSIYTNELTAPTKCQGTGTT